jgi:uncharacterized membrane protein
VIRDIYYLFNIYNGIFILNFFGENILVLNQNLMLNYRSTSATVDVVFINLKRVAYFKVIE